jgi:hypothetical protein
MNNILEALTISKIDLDNLVLTKVKQVNNKKIILVKYGKNKSNFVFQTPSLDLVSKQDTSVEVSLSGKEKVKVNNFINFLVNLESKLKYHAQENYSHWFNNSSQTINFQKLIRESDQYKNGTLKFKLINTPEFKTQINNFTDNNLAKDVWAKIILELYAIWIDKQNNFGVYFRPIIVSFENKLKYNYKFADSDSDNDALECDIPDTELPFNNNNNIFMKSKQQQTDVEVLVSHLDLLSSVSSQSSDVLETPKIVSLQKLPSPTRERRSSSSSDSSLCSSLGDSN